LPGIELYLPSAGGEEPEVTAIRNCKSTSIRQAHYKKLIKYTRKTLGAVKSTLLSRREWLDWTAQAAHVIPLIERIIDQARRVVKGENVPAEEKVASLFEPHTDIIVKDKRQAASAKLWEITVWLEIRKTGLWQTNLSFKAIEFKLY
jgi:hypothetical protein